MVLRSIYLKVQMDVKIEGACDWCCDLSRRCALMPGQEQWRGRESVIAVRRRQTVLIAYFRRL